MSEGMDVVFKHSCDLCHDLFTADDLADPHGVVRLNVIGGTETVEDGKVGRHWIIVGFGSGIADLVVHGRCMVEKGRRVGRWTEEGE